MSKCGLCVTKDVVTVRSENEKLKRQMEHMKNEDDKRKEAVCTKRIRKHGQPLLRG